ncbi:class I SAM-dependent methyltransferase [Piscinibacter sp.]|uniref:class I SAM-dependent methyltransferase n=1 Tax=Piscinibacter sp. TaxID=1903157 RepID=UPI0039E60241
MKEVDAVRERYARRDSQATQQRYSLLNESALLPRQEWERAVVRWAKRSGMAPLESRSLLEVGCGAGANLIEFMRLGFQPENLVGNELLPERSEAARRLLPVAVRVIAGDATQMDVAPQSFDVVLQSTVFSSLLDDAFQQRLADAMWRWIKPGGGVLWYDFVYDNPTNPDVRGVPLRRIRELFPQGRVDARRITLAPPIARRVCRVHPSLYTVFNALPLLRTHLLCWIEKP